MTYRRFTSSLQQRIPLRASRPRIPKTDAYKNSTEDFPQNQSDNDEDNLYRTRSNTSVVYRGNAGVPLTKSPRIQEIMVPVPMVPRRFKTYCVACAAVGFLIPLLGITVIPPFYTSWNNDRLYGYPRKFEIEANVGHGTSAYPNTEFIGTNNHGNIQVVELPEDTSLPSSSYHVYGIIRIQGPDADKVPVTLSFQEENGKKDMVVLVGQDVYTLKNNGTEFKQQ